MLLENIIIGTNYYTKINICPTCKRPKETIHLGKSSIFLKNNYMKKKFIIITLLFIAIDIYFIAFYKPIGKIEYNPAQIQVKKIIKEDTAIASWYDYQLDGIWWSKEYNTAASKDYPQKTQLKVTNVENNKSIIVFVNDYGPEEWTNRQIDLSSHAFQQLAPLSIGLIKVIIEPIQ